MLGSSPASPKRLLGELYQTTTIVEGKLTFSDQYEKTPVIVI